MPRAEEHVRIDKSRLLLAGHVKICEGLCPLLRNLRPQQSIPTCSARPQPLPIPSNAWQSVSMNLIMELPKSDTYDTILVSVDCFSKMAHFIPTRSDVTAEQTAALYVKEVFRLHGLPKDIVSDRGQQFTSRFTRRLLELCEIKSNLSTAYHPQSDSQMERTNQRNSCLLRNSCTIIQKAHRQSLLPSLPVMAITPVTP